MRARRRQRGMADDGSGRAAMAALLQWSARPDAVVVQDDTMEQSTLPLPPTALASACTATAAWRRSPSLDSIPAAQAC